MLERNTLPSGIRGLSRRAVVILLEPRQVGKTTSGPGNHQDPTIASVYLDLESPFNRNKLSYPELYLESHQDQVGDPG